MKRCGLSSCGHAVRPNLVRGVVEEEDKEWEKLAEKMRAAKKKETESEGK